MATEAEKLAESMAKAMGMTIAKDDTNPDTIIEKTGDDGTNPEGQGGNEGDKKDNGSGEGQANDGSAAAKPGEKKLPESQAAPVDFEKLLLEKSKGRFKTVEDIERALIEAPATAFANEEVAKLNEFIKSGGNVDDFVRTQRADYSKMPDLDVLREAERQLDPSLSEADITLLLEDKYGVAENATDKEKRLNELRIKRDSVSARNSLIENQKKWLVPKKSTEELAVEAGKWKNDLIAGADRVDGISVRLNETDTFEYKVPVEVKGKIKSDYEQLNNFFKRYINADGSENVEKFVKDMVILNSFDAIVMAAAGFNKSKGKEEVIKDIKQTDFKPGSKPGAGTSPKSIAQQAAEQIFGK